MTVESGVAIASGIVTILTGLVALVRYVLNATAYWPSSPRVRRGVSRRASDSIKSQAVEAEIDEVGSDASGSNWERSIWRTARDFRADAMPGITAFVGFSSVIVIAMFHKVIKGELFTLIPMNPPAPLFGFFLSLTSVSLGAFFAGCVITVFFPGSTPRNPLLAFFGVMGGSIAGGVVFDLVSPEAIGLVWGAFAGICVGLAPVYVNGTIRLIRRWHAKSAIKKAIKHVVANSWQKNDLFNYGAQQANYKLGQTANSFLQFECPETRKWDLDEAARIVGIDPVQFWKAQYNRDDDGLLRRELANRIASIAMSKIRRKRSTEHLQE